MLAEDMKVDDECVKMDSERVAVDSSGRQGL